MKYLFFALAIISLVSGTFFTTNSPFTALALIFSLLGIKVSENE